MKSYQVWKLAQLIRVFKLFRFYNHMSVRLMSVSVGLMDYVPSLLPGLLEGVDVDNMQF